MNITNIGIDKLPLKRPSWFMCNVLVGIAILTRWTVIVENIKEMPNWKLKNVVQWIDVLW
jgi:hypothetical protein